MIWWKTWYNAENFPVPRTSFRVTTLHVYSNLYFMGYIYNVAYVCTVDLKVWCGIELQKKKVCIFNVRCIFSNQCLSWHQIKMCNIIFINNSANQSQNTQNNVRKCSHFRRINCSHMVLIWSKLLLCDISVLIIFLLSLSLLFRDVYMWSACHLRRLAWHSGAYKEAGLMVRPCLL